MTFMTISAMVTNGKRSLGMLALSGNTSATSCARPRAAARLGHAGARAGHVLVGVVGRAHERAGGDVLESHRVCRALELGELVRVPVAHDGKVLLGRTQVLADGKHRDAALAQACERLEQLVLALA